MVRLGKLLKGLAELFHKLAIFHQKGKLAMKEGTTVVAAWDNGLRTSVETHLIPQLRLERGIIGHGLLSDSGFRIGDMPEHERLERLLEHVGKMIVCVSGIAASEVWAIRLAFERRIKLGLIVSTDDQWKWQALPGLQVGGTYDFVVSVRGPKKRLPNMFPGTRTLYVDRLGEREAEPLVHFVRGL